MKAPIASAPKVMTTRLMATVPYPRVVTLRKWVRVPADDCPVDQGVDDPHARDDQGLTKELETERWAGSEECPAENEHRRCDVVKSSVRKDVESNRVRQRSKHKREDKSGHGDHDQGVKVHDPE